GWAREGARPSRTFASAQRRSHRGGRIIRSREHPAHTGARAKAEAYSPSEGHTQSPRPHSARIRGALPHSPRHAQGLGTGQKPTGHLRASLSEGDRTKSEGRHEGIGNRAISGG